MGGLTRENIEAISRKTTAYVSGLRFLVVPSSLLDQFQTRSMAIKSRERSYVYSWNPTRRVTAIKREKTKGWDSRRPPDLRTDITASARNTIEIIITSSKIKCADARLLRTRSTNPRMFGISET